ncbi:catalase family protein [Anatilimnocola floriformis]|uniref:catalase family protein n=1 Tax=Anatilimnocola floriformis TaxID=2948575 RepID=UPI0020C312A8|nr:catalase family protein [Anatilimnocola floriformis]
MKTPLPFSDSVETIPADEAQQIARIVEIVQQTQKIHFDKTGELHRDVHAKANGCARGELRISAGLPAELAQGLFVQPATYHAAVRFSNSAPWFQADLVPDGRGLAIQVEDVPGEHVDDGVTTQDFVMVNHPCFITADVREFLEIEEARLRAADDPIQLAAVLASKEWNPLKWNWRESLALAQLVAQLPSHPASYTYYSMSPIRFGNYVAKYRLQPAVDLPSSTLWSAARVATERDAMRHMLAETLQSQELTFEFQVQLRTAEESMPIEDASVTWPEAESPFRTVAQLVLPRQDISAPEVSAAGERRAFSVWHALAAHRPLGGINRLRRAVYPASAKFRGA